MNEPIEILQELEKNKIEYVVLRGYIPIEKINFSKDVDIYIPYKYKKKVEKFFEKKGWYTTRINYARFPHKQYICVTETGFKKIDVVFGLFYGKKLFHYLKEKELIDTRKKVDGIYVPKEVLAIETLVLHICFDKGNLSENNKKNIELLLKSTSNDYENNLFIQIAKRLLKEKWNKDCFREHKKTILEKNIVKTNPKHFYYMLKFRLNSYLLAFIKRVKNNSLCIIGVDGTGKSTTIENLKKLFDDKMVIQYMGFKNFEKKCVNKYMEKNKKGKLYKFNVLVIQWYDFICRYLKNRFSKKIVLFDRYPDESIICFDGIAKIIAFIQYKLFFPRPKNIYYLYCSETTSLRRKNDIDDEKRFIEKKRRFDNKYMNMKKVIKISTDSNTNEEVQRIIVENLNKKNIKYFL